MLSIYKVNKKYRKIQKYPIYLKIGAEIIKNIEWNRKKHKYT